MFNNSEIVSLSLFTYNFRANVLAVFMEQQD